MSELQSLGAIYWGQVWLDGLRDQAKLDSSLLSVGETYARHDWGLEVFVDKGRAEATASTGRRLQYDITIELPVLDDDQWDRLLQRIARSSAQSAALFDGVVDAAIINQGKSEEADLLPRQNELTWSCDCERIRTDAQLCKHAAAVLYLLADAFDDNPFDLLLFRGRSRDEIRAVVSELRSDLDIAPPADEGAEQAWSRARGPLPVLPSSPEAPGDLTPWSSDPPPSAPFSAEGLLAIGTEAAQRAWQMLNEPSMNSQLDLDRAADLARRASLAEGTSQWKDLVRSSGLTSQELSARSTAWRIAGSAGVDIHLYHRELIKVSGRAQVRQAEDERWFRFEKVAGRWRLHSGPVDDPELLLSTKDLHAGERMAPSEQQDLAPPDSTGGG